MRPLLLHQNYSNEHVALKPFGEHKQRRKEQQKLGQLEGHEETPSECQEQRRLLRLIHPEPNRGRWGSLMEGRHPACVALLSTPSLPPSHPTIANATLPCGLSRRGCLIRKFYFRTSECCRYVSSTWNRAASSILQKKPDTRRDSISGGPDLEHIEVSAFQ